MFFLRTFPLSFSILWRFLLILPLWTIFYVVITVIAIFGAFDLLESIPIVGMLLLVFLPLTVTVISYVISMHPYLIGIRIGLRVLGIQTESSQPRLMLAAVGYGFLEAMIAFLFTAGIFAAWILLVQNELSLAVAWQVDKVNDPIASLSRQIALGLMTFLSISSAIVAMAVRAALLPVLASAAAGRKPNGGSHAAFDGFGERFPVMLLFLLMITAISTAAIPCLGDAFRYIGLTELLVSKLDDFVLFVAGENEVEFTLAHAAAIIIAIFFAVWLFCLQCAGAALNYENRIGLSAQQIGAFQADQQESRKEIGALLRSRMPKNSN